MSAPFTITDHDGATVEVTECGQGEHGYLNVTDADGRVAGQACVEALEIPGLCAALYEACDVQPPVMLGRPDVSAGAEAFRGLRLSRAADGSGVTFSVGGNAETLAPHQVRAMSAYAVALADSGEQDDDGEFELAAILARHPHATFPEMARAVLADGRFRRVATEGEAAT